VRLGVYTQPTLLGQLARVVTHFEFRASSGTQTQAGVSVLGPILDPSSGNCQAAYARYRESCKDFGTVCGPTLGGVTDDVSDSPLPVSEFGQCARTGLDGTTILSHKESSAWKPSDHSVWGWLSRGLPLRNFWIVALGPSLLFWASVRARL
jgi:hypothetical protein